MPQLRGFHHYYFGLILLLAGFLLIFTPCPIWILCVLIGLGLVLVIDDTYQHLRQRKEPKYHSPIHRLYGWFHARIKFLRKLNEIFDKLFGGKNGKP